MKSFTVELDDDTYFFLEFLERTRSIRNKDEAVRKALIMFKDLSMHDWLPHIYRIGTSRIILMERGMLLDVFESLTELETYRTGARARVGEQRQERRPTGVGQEDNLPLAARPASFNDGDRGLTERVHQDRPRGNL